MATFITKDRPDNLVVRIMGEPWIITFKTKEEDPKLIECDGYCDESTKTIVIEWFKWDGMNKNNMAKYVSTVVRHEMIHAMLYESGLDANTINNWARNEEMVDWIAIQLPKLAETILPISKEICTTLEKDLTVVE